MDRFTIRRGTAPPEGDALLPCELGFCEENSALYIGGEAGAVRLTFPEATPPQTPAFFTFTKPSDASEVPNGSLFTDAEGRLCFKNNIGETLTLV